jgi:hypothetical protein
VAPRIPWGLFDFKEKKEKKPGPKTTGQTSVRKGYSEVFEAKRRKKRQRGKPWFSLGELSAKGARRQSERGESNPRLFLGREPFYH